MLNKMVSLAIGAGCLVVVAIAATAQVKQAQSPQPETAQPPASPPIASPQPTVRSFPLFTESVSANRVRVAPHPELTLPPLPIPESSSRIELKSEAEILDNYDQLMEGVVSSRRRVDRLSESPITPAPSGVAVNDDLPYRVVPLVPRASSITPQLSQSQTPEWSPSAIPILEPDSKEPQLLLEPQQQTGKDR
ncbi:MAG: hypothetical protein F6K32_07240 [Desertifilum sp. SIO1I2]|nr:hypothetical protein [Desertifilum sp. SIO1I2]